MKNKIVFLDRDGVINKDSPNYIKSLSEFEFIPGALEALSLLTQNRFDVILITNQSAINRKLTSLAKIIEIHTHIQSAAINNGGKILDIFYCPHTPNEKCECRKPKPGMIFTAQKKYNLDLSQSFMVGDSLKDIECAHNAGCKSSVLVLTGNGLHTRKNLIKLSTPPAHIAKNLFTAAKWVVSAAK